jgi:hypothetical protein
MLDNDLLFTAARVWLHVGIVANAINVFRAARLKTMTAKNVMERFNWMSVLFNGVVCLL